MKLTLLQTAVRSINDLTVVETSDEFQSSTHGPGSSTSLSYQTYYDLLINGCVRYDKTRKAKIGNRRNVCNINIDTTYVDYPTDVIDYVPDSFHGGVDFPADESDQIHAFTSRHPPSPRPGNPSRSPFRPQSQQSGHQKPFQSYYDYLKVHPFEIKYTDGQQKPYELMRIPVAWHMLGSKPK